MKMLMRLGRMAFWMLLASVVEGQGGTHGARGRSTQHTLHKIAVNARTDKALYHQYTLFYDMWLGQWRHRRFDMLEIGVYREESLKMWEKYFPNARIMGADAYPDKRWRNPIVVANQERMGDLQKLASLHSWSVIVDDGSHAPRHQFNTFITLFPVLQPGGVYIIEDIETHWWKTLPYGVKSRRDDPHVFELFRQASRDILQRDFLCEQPRPIFSPSVDHAVGSISFITNAIIVTKKPSAYTRDRIAYRDRDKLRCTIRAQMLLPWMLVGGILVAIVGLALCACWMRSLRAQHSTSANK